MYGEYGERFFEAATMNVTSGMSIFMLALILVIGWLFTYKQHYVNVPVGQHKPNKVKWRSYKFLAKEGYISDMYVKYFKIF